MTARIQSPKMGPMATDGPAELEAPDRKQALRGVFDRAAGTYGGVRYFPILGRWLAEVGEVAPGARVLDVACGRGAALFAAAERAGVSGHVTGIDLSDGMVAETATAAARLGLEQVDVLQMDAEQLEFADESFDAVLSGFSLQFLADLDRALSGFRRVLRPGGRLAVTTWGDDDARWAWFDDLRASYDAVVKLRSQSLEQPGELIARLQGAGFEEARVVTRELEMVYPDAEEWWTMQWSISGRAGMERLGPDRLAQFKHEVFARMEPLREADGFHDRLTAHCATGARSR